MDLTETSDGWSCIPVSVCSMLLPLFISDWLSCCKLYFAKEKNPLHNSVPLCFAIHTRTREHAHTQTKDQEGETLPYFSYNEIIVTVTENVLSILSKESVIVSWRKTTDHES